MRLARRGFILGAASLLSGCATAAAQTASVAPSLVTPIPDPIQARPPEIITSQLNTTRPLDPRGQIRK